MSFDSKSERQFYLLLKRLLPTIKVIRPCPVSLQGKARQWKCDFGLLANTDEDSMRLGMLTSAMKGINTYRSRSLVYLEFKGETDLSTGFIRPDKNFISRVNHLVRYEPSILENTIFVGSGSGSILTYCGSGSFCATHIHSTDYFSEQVGKIW